MAPFQPVSNSPAGYLADYAEALTDLATTCVDGSIELEQARSAAEESLRIYEHCSADQDGVVDVLTTYARILDKLGATETADTVRGQIRSLRNDSSGS